MRLTVIAMLAALAASAPAQSLEERVTALEKTVKVQEDRLAQMEFLVAPVGTITAFAGPVERIPHNWMLCNGDELDKNQEPLLYNAIGNAWGGTGSPKFRLPDLRGRFLRGVDGGKGLDVEAATRNYARPEDPAGLQGNRGDQVGSTQDERTKMPVSAFVNSAAGQHNHLSDPSYDRVMAHNGEGTVKDVDNNDGDEHTEPNLQHSRLLVPAGQHSHNITGGDLETRPKNAAVLWIIKVR